MKEKLDKIFKNINGIQIELNDEEYKEFFEREEKFLKEISQELKPSTEEKRKTLKNQLLSSRNKYLESTQYYVIKDLDIPNSCPQDIKIKRINAWQEIDEIESANTLSALNNFDINFE